MDKHTKLASFNDKCQKDPWEWVNPTSGHYYIRHEINQSEWRVERHKFVRKECKRRKNRNIYKQLTNVPSLIRVIFYGR